MVNTNLIVQEKIKAMAILTALIVKNLLIKSTEKEAIKVENTKRAKPVDKGLTKAESTLGRKTENNPSPN